jgi:hypothetical protein
MSPYNMERWKYINLNPFSPMIRGLIKIHKADPPIRPRVNWKDAPAYNLARILARNLELFIPLPYIFNIRNTV